MTWVDVLLIAIMGLSGFLAMVRGFTREVLSISSWALAALATIYITPKYEDQARALIPDPPILGLVILGAGIFITVLIIVSLLTVKLSDRFLDSDIGVLDRTFGFAFGLGRGLILVGILYLILAWLVPKENMPAGVENARTLPLIENTGNLIASVLPVNPIKELQEKLDQKSGDKNSRIERNDPLFTHRKFVRREIRTGGSIKRNLLVLTR